MTVDRHDLTGKIAPPEAHYGCVVVGAGDAGIAAALAAAAGGVSVLLVDENPIPAAWMGSDVPLFWGGRMTAATQQPGRMVEQLLASRPGLEAAFDAGIDVRLGTAAWGLYRPGPGLGVLPGPMLGLADAERAWMAGYDRLVLATGARDVVLAFPGWDRPGVMGAQALQALLTRYDAFAGRRVLVLGSGSLALETALLAHARGLDVAGIVEVEASLRASPELAEKLSAARIPVYLGYVVSSCSGGTDGVERAVLRPVTGGEPVEIACDTICLALGTSPSVELLEGNGRGVELTGDCAGPESDPDYIAAWSRATAIGDDVVVCQCEAVTRGDLLTMQPPRYLDQPIPARALADYPHPDQVKRLTRAGMGPCQGRRCRTQIACLLAAATGVPVAQVPVACVRSPVRPIPLKILADWQEPAAMAAGWDVWFGIPTQWIPYADIGTAREAKLLADAGNMHV